MFRFILIFSLIFSLSTFAEEPLNTLETDVPETPVPEDWKWPRSKTVWDLGGLTGIEMLDGSVGFPVKISAAYLIDDNGWIEDINNQIFLETIMGPLFIGGSAAFTYSLHLRWNFFKTYSTGYYATMGLGGLFTGTTLGDRDRIYPRLAIGMLKEIGSEVFLRVEISQEMISVGAVVGL